MAKLTLKSAQIKNRITLKNTQTKALAQRYITSLKAAENNFKATGPNVLAAGINRVILKLSVYYPAIRTTQEYKQLMKDLQDFTNAFDTLTTKLVYPIQSGRDFHLNWVLLTNTTTILAVTDLPIQITTDGNIIFSNLAAKTSDSVKWDECMRKIGKILL